MDTNKPTIKQILDWCLKKTEEGSEVVLLWDGGNDSGWVHLEVDGEDTYAPEANALIDMMYEQLDYGSWAGDFSASGEAHFSAEEKLFQGYDNYSTTESESAPAAIEIRIPKYIHFDQISIDTEDENCTTNIRFDIRNGFMHPKTTAVISQLEKDLPEQIIKAVDAVVESSHEIDGFWESYQLSRTDDFTEDGEDMVHIMKNVTYQKINTTDSHIEINLQELLEEETQYEL
jgi:hypothetical protein